MDRGVSILTLSKPKIPNSRLHDGENPATYLNYRGRHMLDVAVGDVNSGLSDGFGRLRISHPFTMFDSKMTNDNQPLFWDDQEVSGGGTSSTYNSNQASVSLGVSATTAGRRIRQTKRRFNYQPGKSLLIIMTGVLGTAAAGVKKKIGYFDDKNGLFFQLNGTTLQVGKRTYTSGTAVDTLVDQSNWNTDKMDGTGKSGITIDTATTQIFFIDLEWLGVGRVRFGLFIDGVPLYVHEFYHANVLDKVYMSTPNLPARYEIENTGTGAASTMVQICCTVISEGGHELTGYVRSIDNGVTAIAANTIGTEYALIGLRLKSTRLDVSVQVHGLSILCATTNDQFLWRWKLNPTVAGTFTFADLANSAMQTAIGAAANTVTGGTAIDAGYGQASGVIESASDSQLLLGSKIDGTQDILVLTCTPVTANQNIYAAVHWREFI